MKKVDIHEAKTHLSSPVERAAKGIGARRLDPEALRSNTARNSRGDES